MGWLFFTRFAVVQWEFFDILCWHWYGSKRNAQGKIQLILINIWIDGFLNGNFTFNDLKLFTEKLTSNMNSNIFVCLWSNILSCVLHFEEAYSFNKLEKKRSQLNTNWKWKCERMRENCTLLKMNELKRWNQNYWGIYWSQMLNFFLSLLFSYFPVFNRCCEFVLFIN